ncbi:MAG: hypothetical protein GC158_14390 [Cyanobacteria bacterium RI_101]|nr:hypothetical protein [Cyanobacteria bacterium RI_101]
MGLIPPVSPEQRLKEVDRGRVNPFGLLNFQVIAPPKAPVNPPQGGKAGSKGSPASGGQAGVKGSVGAKGGASNPAQPGAPGTVVVKGASPAIVKPVKPPTEARQVYVTGIINFPGSPVAILRAPGDLLEKNVRAGAALADGLVRVVSINASNQTVTLEQYGQRVTRKVGDDPNPPAPTAAAPPPASNQPQATAPQEVPPQIAANLENLNNAPAGAVPSPPPAAAIVEAAPQPSVYQRFIGIQPQ